MSPTAPGSQEPTSQPTDHPMTTGKNGPTMSKVGKTEANCGENVADRNSELPPADPFEPPRHEETQISFRRSLCQPVEALDRSSLPWTVGTFPSPQKTPHEVRHFLRVGGWGEGAGQEPSGASTVTERDGSRVSFGHDLGFYSPRRRGRRTPTVMRIAAMYQGPSRPISSEPDTRQAPP